MKRMKRSEILDESLMRRVFSFSEIDVLFVVFNKRLVLGFLDVKTFSQHQDVHQDVRNHIRYTFQYNIQYDSTNDIDNLS